MIHDDSKYIKLHAQKLNKKYGAAKAKTIALERAKGITLKKGNDRATGIYNSRKILG